MLALGHTCCGIGVSRFPFRQSDKIFDEGSIEAYKMISSTALPNETFNRAPKVSPRRLATLSVAWLNSPARGMMAMAFMAKMSEGLFGAANFTAMPMGTKNSRMLTQL